MTTKKFWFGIISYAVIYCVMIFLVSSCESYNKIETSDGIICLESRYVFDHEITCNWDSWNLKTNYGMYPEKALEK